MAPIHSFILLLATVAPCLGASTHCPPKLPAAKPGSNTTVFTAEFDSFVESLLSELNVPGMSVAVINGNQTSAKGYGYATLPDKKAAADTLWHGASTTKAFVGATLSHFINNETHPDLLGDGWQTPIWSIIPKDFKLSDDWATKHVTLEDAISHRTGLPRHDYAWQYTSGNGSSRTSAGDVVRTLRHLPLVAEPRVAVQYNNLMYVVLSHVIETVTAKPLKAVFKELIWGPLGMTSTFLDDEDAKAAAAGDRLATGYGWNNVTKKHTAITRDYLQSGGAGAAGIVTSVEDLARWVKSLMHKTGPLSNDMHMDIRRSRSIFIDTPNPKTALDVRLYSLGWQRTTFHGEELYFHGGESLAFGTTIWWLPGRKFGIVAMGSVYEHANAASVAIVRRLAADVLGIAPEKRSDDVATGKQDLYRLHHTFDNAIADVYGKRNESDPKTPPVAPLSALAGTYKDPGYGTIVLKVAGNATTPTLIAERPDMVYQYNIRIQHVSGDDWLAFFESRLGSILPIEVFEAHFVTAGNAATALTINFWAAPKRYTTTFTKVA